MRLELVLINKL